MVKKKESNPQKLDEKLIGDGPQYTQVALGRMEQAQDLREIWSHEEKNFTPWLAEPENLGLLGAALGLELEEPRKEADVGLGKYTADIVCNDANSRFNVVIENQLEVTDHIHLGELLTYMAGVKARIAVWVAKNFTDGHRAAIDWLNENSIDKMSFFGVEIQIWRINNSIPPAAMFKVVAQPNDWVRKVRRLTSKEELSDAGKLYSEYWEEFAAFLEKANSALKFTPHARNHTFFYTVGRSREFALKASFSLQKKSMEVRLALYEQTARIHYSLLEKQKKDIEKRFGNSLDWKERAGLKESSISTTQECDPANRELWEDMFRWMVDTLQKFTEVFRERVSRLSTSDYWLDRLLTEGIGSFEITYDELIKHLRLAEIPPGSEHKVATALVASIHEHDETGVEITQGVQDLVDAIGCPYGYDTAPAIERLVKEIKKAKSRK